MTTPDRTWFEQTLFDHNPVYELRLTLGIIPGADHAQWQVELRDPVDGRLIDLVSCPHRPWTNPLELVEEAVSKVVPMLNEHIAPF